MNFGNWIVVAFILFAVFIGTLVTVCVKQDISLVSKNYYQDELVYQDQITRMNNAKALKKMPTIVTVGSSLQVTFDSHYTIDSGELTLFCPSDPGMDKVFTLLHNEGATTQAFDINATKPGMYKAKLRWSMNGKEYFVEEIIYR